MAPTLRLYNTLTRTKEDFVPIDPSNVRMYVCGPTVYDYAHIGNARPVIVFDLLFRLLRHLYGPEHVTYVRNVTDVDDKINARAAERGVPIRDITEGTLAQFHADIAALGVLEPTRRAARDRAHRRDADADRAPRRERARLCRRGARALRRAVDAGLRPALEAPARRDGGRRPRRRRALQALAARLRAVEAVEARRAGLGLARRHRDAGAARLAHRVLGDVVEAPRRGLRHPRRRHRPRLPPPRERGRPVPLLVRHARRWPTSGCTTASCRSRARRCPRAWGTSSPSTSSWRRMCSVDGVGPARSFGSRC